MDNITGQNVTVGLVETHPFLYDSLCLISVIEHWSSVAGSHTISQVLGQCPLVLQQMFRKWLKLCSLATWVKDN